MPVPKYCDFFPYVMMCLADKQSHMAKEINEYCADCVGLTKQDRRETLSSGVLVYVSRVGWARTYLKKAGLIEKISRSTYRITQIGEEVIMRYKPEEIDLNFLRQFDSFNEFLNSKKETKDTFQSDTVYEKEESPQEKLESAVNEINSSLEDDLIQEVLKMSPYDFELLVVRLLIKMGYGTLRRNKDAVTKKSGDEGIDGVVSADKFGFDSIYIQAKKWQTSSVVGRPEIQKFLGALAGQGATKGIFITTAHYSKEAIEFANKQLHQKIVLIDGAQLSKLMIEYNLGVSVVETYVVKRIDSDYFNDEM